MHPIVYRLGTVVLVLVSVSLLSTATPGASFSSREPGRRTLDFRLDFRELEVGGRRSDQFNLSVPGVNTAVDIQLNTVLPFIVTPTSFTLPPGEARTIVVDFVPTAVGMVNELVTIVISEQGEHLFTGTIPVTGTGTGIPQILRIVTESLGQLSGGISAFKGYVERLVAAGGRLPYTWRFGVLPPELQGVLELTPDGLLILERGGEGLQGADPIHFSVLVLDSAGTTATRGFTVDFTGEGPGSVIILTDSQDLDTGIVGVDYLEEIRATPTPLGTYVWSLGAGSSFPAGMDFEADGRITGKPQSAGTFPFLAVATDDAGGDTNQKVLAITVEERTLKQIEAGDTIGRVVAGGGTWKTEFQLFSLDGNDSHNFDLMFFDSNGEPLAYELFENDIPIGTHSVLSGTLAPRGTRVVRTSDTGDIDSQSGYARLVPDEAGTVAVNAVITNLFGGDPTRSSRASVPNLAANQTRVIFPFRQAAPFDTCLAITSLTQQTISVTAFVNGLAPSCQSLINIGANEHQAFCLSDGPLPCALGTNGQLEASSQGGMSVISLIFDEEGRLYTQVPISQVP